MKKIFVAAVLFIAALSGVNAQDNNKSNNNVTREGKTFIAQSSAKTKSENINTEYSYTDTDGKTYEIWLSKNGRAFILRISKTGKEYRKYLGEEISRQICQEIGREYVETKK